MSKKKVNLNLFYDGARVHLDYARPTIFITKKCEHQETVKIWKKLNEKEAKDDE